jgi:asparagine synthase (glutamine-hydrolysing)
MCGFIGYSGQARTAPSKERISQGLVALEHRGPDDKGQVVIDAGGVTCHLAHARLSILDLSPLGHQPMTSPDGRYTMAFNGEIFNFLEVRLELEQCGHSFLSHCDTEVLLHAWMEWGTAALPKLRGFFAFAVFDRETGDLTLARDRLGIKPLYYSEQQGGIGFASEIRALLAAGLAERQIDREGLESYLAFGSVSEPYTILAGVRMLPAGTWLRWSPGKIETGVFWKLPPVQVAAGKMSFGEAVEQLREVLRESVRLRLIADVPLGLFLSGGVDSSVLTALAAGESSRPVQTFTVAFGGGALDENRFARLVAERFGCQHHTVLLDRDRAASEIDQAVRALDQPSSDGINTWFVSKATRDAGITVALSGLGGDELFGGYPNFKRIAQLLRVGKFAPSRPFAVAERMVAARGRFLFPNALAKALAVVAESGDLAGLYSVLRACFTQGQRHLLFESDRTVGRFVTMPAGTFENGLQPVTAFSVLEICNYMRNTLLRDTDVMSMAHALEVRVPLLDHRVVEFVMSLPDALKVRSGPNKALLAAVVPELPPEAVQRRKMGFTLPFDQWFRGPLRSWMEERLFSGELVRSGLTDHQSVRRLWSGYLRGERYVSHSRVWSLAVLAQWCASNGISLDTRALRERAAS